MTSRATYHRPTLLALTHMAQQLEHHTSRLEALTAELLPHLMTAPRTRHDVSARLALLQQDLAYIADCLMEWECTKHTTRTQAS